MFSTRRSLPVCAAAVALVLAGCTTPPPPPPAKPAQPAPVTPTAPATPAQPPVQPAVPAAPTPPEGGAHAVDYARAIVTRLDHTCLPIQGPPGAGKTFTGARMIEALVADGFKVGVTATSHKVIRNLLDAVANTAREQQDFVPRDIRGTFWRFLPTKPLPTYLAAFACGPFATLEAPQPDAPGITTTAPMHGMRRADRSVCRADRQAIRSTRRSFKQAGRPAIP